MRHRVRVLHLRAPGLTPYRVVCRRAHSHPLQSLRDAGLWYRHPAWEDTAIVCAQDTARIAAILPYHDQDSGNHLRVLPA
jgi:hypothetical protein